MKAANSVLSSYGTTVFEVMSRLAIEHKSINLGQGFPDDFFLAESRTKSMRLLGNSVAVNVIYHIGTNLITYLENKEKFVFENLFEPMLKETT